MVRKKKTSLQRMDSYSDSSGDGEGGGEDEDYSETSEEDAEYHPPPPPIPYFVPQAPAGMKEVPQAPAPESLDESAAAVEKAQAGLDAVVEVGKNASNEKKAQYEEKLTWHKMKIQVAQARHKRLMAEWSKHYDYQAKERSAIYEASAKRRAHERASARNGKMPIFKKRRRKESAELPRRKIAWVCVSSSTGLSMLDMARKAHSTYAWGFHWVPASNTQTKKDGRPQRLGPGGIYSPLTANKRKFLDDGRNALRIVANPKNPNDSSIEIDNRCTLPALERSRSTYQMSETLGVPPPSGLSVPADHQARLIISHTISL